MVSNSVAQENPEIRHFQRTSWTIHYETNPLPNQHERAIESWGHQELARAFREQKIKIKQLQDYNQA